MISLPWIQKRQDSCMEGSHQVGEQQLPSSRKIVILMLMELQASSVRFLDAGNGRNSLLKPRWF
jgi:hypothetical protein